MELAKLTFRELDERLDALPQHPCVSTQVSKRTQWAYVIGLSAWAGGILAAKLFPTNALYTVAIALTMLITEIVVLGVAIIPKRPWKMPGFQSERREYAEQLDHEMPGHLPLVEWLSRFPREQLETLADYATLRHERMKDKLPLPTGSIEKLGALPVLIALFIQLKDLRWPPQASLPEVILCFALATCYWMSLLQLNLRFRVQLHEALLSSALAVAEPRL